ncbi:MAG TPA: type III-A CRISPR-associated RAMP protein Csm3 [Acetivibrio sp.]|nr:type III-A CRISPR-associated RAMP protein Csm3 [Acetivibrio sp.]
MMGNEDKRFSLLYGHVIMRGKIRCISGLHIGGSDNSIQIGGVNSTIIRNPLTGEPYIPGSSLKGKIRSTMEKWVRNGDGLFLTANRCGDERNKDIYRHECDDAIKASKCPLCRILGSTGREEKNNGSSDSKKENRSFPSSLIVRDCLLYNHSEMSEDGLFITEAKTENTLDRITSKATPRTIERVPAGAEFSFEMILKVSDFNLDNNSDNKLDFERVKKKVDNVKIDLKNLLETMKMVEFDGIGGNVSRGYGKIKFYFNEFIFEETPLIKEILENNKEELILFENINSRVNGFTYGCSDYEVNGQANKLSQTDPSADNSTDNETNGQEKMKDINEILKLLKTDN